MDGELSHGQNTSFAMDEREQFNSDITNRLVDPDWHEKRSVEQSLGHQSPHNAFAFAEEIARGNFVHDKLEAAQTAGEAESASVLDLASAHLQAREKQPEDPLGKTHTEMFHAIYGTHPFTESNVHETTIEPPTSMHIQSKEEQDRRNQQIAEQEQVSMSHAGLPSGYREEQASDRQEPEAQAKSGMEVSSQTQTQKEPELENQPVGSMGVNEATQADLGMAAGGNGGDGGGPPNDNDIDLSKVNFGTSGQNARDEFVAGQQHYETPAINSLDEPLEDHREIESSVLDKAPEAQQGGQEIEGSVLDRAPEAQHGGQEIESSVLDKAPEAAPANDGSGIERVVARNLLSAGGS